MNKILRIAKKNKAFHSFLFGFVFYILIMLPDLYINKGIVFGSADYNLQSIPFIYHIRETILTGSDLFWDSSSGLGGQFLSQYAYYNLFSPFSFIYLITPYNLISYIIPYVTALKFGFGSMLAYFYIRRYVKNSHYAVIGGIVYAFSSFTAYNLVFHFADAIMLFPFLLISLDELCINNRRGMFAASVALMAFVNYYFFFGQALFCVIYFFIRCTDKNFGNGIRKLPGVIIEAVLGCGTAMVLLLPVMFTLAESGKATGLIQPSEMLFYESVFHYLKIVQSAFMVPDPFAYTSLFPEVQSTYPFGVIGASVAAYIPLFSSAGIISYIIKNRRRWQSYILVLCVIMSLIPVLNQSFSMFNSAFYARWYYMPMLIGILVSVKSLEDEISFKPGIIVCSFVLGSLIICQFFFSDEYVTRYTVSIATHSFIQNIIHFVISVISLAILAVTVRMKRDKEFIPKLYIMTIVCCYMTFGIMTHYFLTGSGFSDKKSFIERLNLTSELPEEFDKNERAALRYGVRNYNLIWGVDSTNFFNSLCDSGFAEFLEDSNLVNLRGTYKDITLDEKELCDLLSVKYFIASEDDLHEKMSVTLLDVFGEYYIYENNDYIPMGFTYSSMISDEAYSVIVDEKQSKRIYLKSLVVDNPNDFLDILTIDDNNSAKSISDEEYCELINQRRSEACYNMKKNNKGLTANVNLSSKNIVFFSISYNDSWKAYVDGEESEVYKVNNGMIGVVVPEGEHELSLEYTVKGLATGVIISCFSLAVFVVYIFINKRRDTADVSKN